MHESFYIKPASEGLIVRDPVTRDPLAAAGEEKPRNKYWLAREADRSVIQVEKPVAKAEAPATRSQKKEGDQ